MAKSDQLNGDGHSETIFKYPEIANSFSGSQRLLRNDFSITSSLCKRSTLRKKNHDSYDSLNITMSHIKPSFRTVPKDSFRSSFDFLLFVSSNGTFKIISFSKCLVIIKLSEMSFQIIGDWLLNPI